MNKLNCCLFFLIAVFFKTLGQEKNVSVEGVLKKWHKITLSFEGEHLSESDEINPFLNYRLNVYFKNNNKTHIIPGFFAADGNAAETSAKSGQIWKVRFSPDEPGEWSYKVSFRKGENIAISDDIYAGEPIAFDGITGTIIVEDLNQKDSQIKSKGRLQYTGERYLKFADSKEAFLKGGADSPENFLAYYEFDDTPDSHKYEAHAVDWVNGDPIWKDGKGKNIIGALNYLASKGMNSVYFLTMNVQGDGNDVWPWTSINERYRFDCSKLDQWEVVFDHMDNLGLMLHIVTQETENELLLDIGDLGVQRKLYYRELIARFAHHLRLTWNLGEENGPLNWTPKGQTDEDRKNMARFISINDPYKNFVALHTHAEIEDQKLFLNPLLGYRFLDGPSLQLFHPEDVNQMTLKWINESKKFHNQWVVSLDEIGPYHTGAKPDSEDPEHYDMRSKVLWGNLMAGGAGVEWYFGYKYDNNDLTCEDWRSRNNLWEQTFHALEFFMKYIPFENMTSANDLTSNLDDYVFAKKDDVYLIYLPSASETKLNLGDTNSKFSVKWYNPESGGSLLDGTVKQIIGGSEVSIGKPPYVHKDWVALIKNLDTKTKQAIEKNYILLNALKDFKISDQEVVRYYKEPAKQTLAIDASRKDQRDDYAMAYHIFRGRTGHYLTTLNIVAENDGESTYEIRVNSNVYRKLSSMPTSQAFELNKLNLGNIYLRTNDTIKILSKAETNGRIPENEETAWSRGRWSSLHLKPIELDLKQNLRDFNSYEEKNGYLEIEAEDYHYKSNNNSPRNWYKISNDEIHFNASTNHSLTASGMSYIEALPDTRKSHSDKLIFGENFFPVPGIGGIVSYKIKINNPGRYICWVRAFSTDTEDNGVHVGLDGVWPESGQRIQFCEGKDKWVWSSAQRVPENHCGFPKSINLDFEKAGEYVISFSMREDGFEMDKFILTKDKNFIP